MAAHPPPARDWLNEPLRAVRDVSRDTLQALQQAQRDINRALKEIERRAGQLGVGEMLRQEQLLLAKRAIQGEQAKLWRKLGDAVKARRLEAAARAIVVGERLDNYILGKVAGLPHADRLAAGIAGAQRDAAESGLDRVMARVLGDSHVPLATRVYNSEVGINSRIDRMVNSALARGLSAREFAAEARAYINPNTPGGLRYAAMRLARTEVNNAAHAVSIAGAQERPWVLGMKWHLSGSHPRPDICDSLAHGGDGKGIYAKDAVPAKPHPHCFCFVTPETEDEESFLDNLVAGQYNDYLSRYENLQPGQVLRTNARGGVTEISPPTRVRVPRPAKAASTQVPLPAKPEPPPVVPEPIAVTAETSRVEALQAMLDSGVESSRFLGVGMMSDTEMVEFKNGGRAIRKRDRGYSGNAKGAMDSEELASIVGRDIVNAPAVLRISEDTILMDVVPGEMGMELGGFPKVYPDNRETFDRMGLFDAMIGNLDRNEGNWLFHEGKVFPIDHGMTFGGYMSPDDAGNFFAALSKSRGLQDARQAVFRNGFAAEDIAFLKAHLAKFEQDFTRLGRHYWYRDAQTRLDEAARFAKPQKKPVFAPVAEPSPLETLRVMLDSGEKSVQRLGTGLMGETDLVEYNNGGKAIRKKDRGYNGPPKDAADAEELASLIGRDIVNAPAVVRIDEETVLMEFARGEMGMNSGGIGALYSDNREEFNRIGLFDAVIGNPDRNNGNWLFREGKVFPVDHGLAFGEADAEDVFDLFETLSLGLNDEEPIELVFKYGFSPADVDFLKAHIQKFEPEFARLGKQEWYRSVQVRLKQLKKFAKKSKKAVFGASAS